jgi:hypothetical protein
MLLSALLIVPTACIGSYEDANSTAISGGDNVPINQSFVPYIADVSVRFGNQIGICSGAFVTSSWVLTAAHCVDTHTADQVQVLFAGEGISQGIDRIVMHPGYRNNTAPTSETTAGTISDLALLHLVEPIASAGVSKVMPLNTQTLAPGTDLDCYAFDPDKRSILRKATWAITQLTTQDGTPGSIGVGYSTRGNLLGQKWQDGDSGGPCFVRSGDPSLPGVLAGIHSLVSTVGGGYPFWQDTALSNYYGWVRSQISADIEDLVVTWGANLGLQPGTSTWTDLSGFVDASIGGSCTGRATCTGNTQTTVDAYPGAAKDLVVQWQCGGFETVNALYLPPSAGDQSFTISCPNPTVTGLQDILATYGPGCADTLGNQTNAVIAACGGRSYCDYPVDPARLGALPAGCAAKSLEVSYRCGTGAVKRVTAAAAPGGKLHLDCRPTAIALPPFHLPH